MHRKRTVWFSAWLALSLAPLALSTPGCAAQGEGEYCSTLNGSDDCEPGLVCRKSMCCPPVGRPSSVAACIESPGGGGGSGGSAGSAGASGGDAASEADAIEELQSDASDEAQADAADETASDGAAE